MAVRDDARPWYRRRCTSVVLEETADGHWRATQRGVTVTGYGDTAAEAAVEYCRLVGEE